MKHGRYFRKANHTQTNVPLHAIGSFTDCRAADVYSIFLAQTMGMN